MLNFGQKIKKLRTDAGLSQAMLAEHIGVSVQSISNWECNNTMPDISQIVPLASILCVSTDYLLGVGFDEKADHETLVRNVNPFGQITLSTQKKTMPICWSLICIRSICASILPITR